MKDLNPVTQTANQLLWQTFTVEETMKKQPAPSKVARKLGLIFLVAIVLLFSACSQQPTPKISEDLESQFVPMTWKQMGGALDVNPAMNSRNPSLAVNAQGSLYAAWSEDSTGLNSMKVIVKRWAAAPFNTWIQVGAALNVDLNKAAFKPAIAVGTDGRPVVAFHECNSGVFPTTDVCDVYVRQYDAGGWKLLGGKLNAGNGYYASLAMDSQNRPVLAWFEKRVILGITGYNIYVKRWDGIKWMSLGGAVNTSLTKLASMPSLAVKNDKIAVAWQECATSGNSNPLTCQHQIFVRNYDAATNTWKASLGASGAINVNSNRDAKLPSLELTSTGTPIVAFVECVQVNAACHENSDHNVYVKRYGTKNIGGFIVFGFHLLGNALDVNILQATKWPSLAIGPSDAPMVAWSEGGSTGSGMAGIRVKRWVEGSASWQFNSGVSGASLNVSQTQHDDEPSLVFSSTGQPSVAFQEAQDGGSGVLANIYVRQLQAQ